MNQGRKLFAPETAVGTGAAEPVVDEYEAAKATPSVDENTLDASGGRSQNQPGDDKVNPSGQTRSEAINEDDAAQSSTVNDDTNEEPSTGEDLETRQKDDDTIAGSAVGAVIDDAEVNSKAEDVRPEVPQDVKPARKARGKQ